MRRRLQEWDFLRAFFAVLGVVLHPAFWFDDRSAVARGIINFITPFRMPGFFLAAGFFAALTLARSSPEVLLRKRFLRLWVPCVTIFVSSFLLAFVLRTCPPFVRTQIVWPDGIMLIQHLWFLSRLLWFVLLLCVAHLAAPQLMRLIQKPIPSWVLLTAFALANLAQLKVTLWIGKFSWALQIHDPRFFLFYFVVGYVVFHQRSLLLSISRNWVFCAAVAFCFWLTSMGSSLWALLHPVYTLVVCAVLLRCAGEFERLRARFDSVFKASYTIYLLHYPVELIGNSALAPLSLHPWIQMGMLIAMGAAVPMAFHYLVVVRSPLARFLVNGEIAAAKVEEAARPAGAPSATAPAVLQPMYVVEPAGLSKTARLRLKVNY